MKRYIDTELYDDEWFQNLSPSYKALWLYIIFRCDSSGFWKLNQKQTEFHTGLTIDWNPDNLNNAFNDGKVRITFFPKAWLIEGFKEFQQGDRVRFCQTQIHAAIMRMYDKNIAKYSPNSSEPIEPTQTVCDSNGEIIEPESMPESTSAIQRLHNGEHISLEEYEQIDTTAKELLKSLVTITDESVFIVV